jgi:hypothetical protein
MCRSLIRHRNVSFSQAELLTDISLPALSLFGCCFKLSSFFFFQPRGTVSPPRLVAANWQATRWFPLTKRRSNVCRRKAHLERMVAVVTRSWLWSHDFFPVPQMAGYISSGISLYRSVHLRWIRLQWHMWVDWDSHGSSNELCREHSNHWFESFCVLGR